jgi:cyclic-di-GMP phosphodiesterase, flagellum assembly factor TipF
MALGKRQKLQLGAALLAAVALTGGTFFYEVSLGIFTAGFLTTCGFILFDRLGRRLWENSVSWQMKKIGDVQQSLENNVAHVAEDINVMKSHIADIGIKSRAKPAEIKTPAPRRAPASIGEEGRMPRAVKPGAAPPKRSYGDLISGQHDLTDNAVRAVVNDALRSERIDVFLQPIVRLPQRKVRYYEMFARIRARPGLYLSAARYLHIAKQHLMIDNIDRLLLNECLSLIKETARVERAAPFFINITSASFKSGAFMKQLLPFLSSRSDLSHRLVFELTQADFKALKPAIIEIMKGLGQLGCTFSIDNINDFNFDVGALLKLKVRYVKISAQDLMARNRNDKELAELQKLKRRLEGNGIAVIAEKIENERMLKELFDFDINYGQGYLFGKPDVQGAYQDKAVRPRARQ